ncbi:uncharacterized protein N7483_002026 [Penicillium malachiteum]|uniref:uncharacterized protein n=1 Tax=Penicillium malachiteum TaxID=1324776 RepID=UPI00254925B9|nr:uncharacterized protein N7483_002026 [Penicillium malachiteum]KAJ5736901.1 hypothetical protein N7483_002026 [Penicillium malachiteum]
MATDNAGFPALKPALITRIHVDPTKIRPFGVSHTGSSLIHFEVPSGTVETVPGFEPEFKAEIVFGGDWFVMDADGKHGRVNFRGIAKTDDGHVIDIRTFGTVDMVPAAAKVFTLQPDMASVPFGHAAARIEYLVNDPKPKFLENSFLVGNAQVIIDETGVTIENRQSIVLTPTIQE